MSKIKTIGFVMDPIQNINFERDSSLVLMLEAQNRGMKVFYFEPHHLFIQDGQAFGLAHTIEVRLDPKQWFIFKATQKMALSELDVIIMRKDPPFNIDYIYQTYILELAKTKGTLVINDPVALRNVSEKVFIQHFAHLSPPTLISKSKTEMLSFWKKHEDIILKPLDLMGGQSIFRLKKDDSNFSAITELLTNRFQNFCVAQKYIAQVEQGDKRLFLIDGGVLPHAFIRIPSKGENSSNLAFGGRALASEVTQHDLELCKQIGPVLKKMGLFLVGLDVIGPWITEINVTSVTGFRMYHQLFQEKPWEIFFDKLEEKFK